MSGKAFTLATVVNNASLPLVAWAADSVGITAPRPVEVLIAAAFAAAVYAIAHAGVRGFVTDLWKGWRS